MAIFEAVLDLLYDLFIFGKHPPRPGSWRARLEMLLLLGGVIVLAYTFLT